MNKLKRNFTVLYKNSFYETYCLYQQMDCIFSPFIFKKRGKGSKTPAGKKVLAFVSPPASSSRGRAEQRIPASSLAVSVYRFFPLGQVTEVPWASTFKCILGNCLYLPHKIVVRSYGVSSSKTLKKCL